MGMFDKIKTGLEEAAGDQGFLTVQPSSKTHKIFAAAADGIAITGQGMV